MLSALGAEVYGADLYPDLEWAKNHKVNIVSIEELIKVSRVLSLHLSHVGEKPFRLGEAEFSQMPKGVLIVNVSRGQFIDEDALLKALLSGQVGGAALDVFQEEPYVGPLCGIDNVVLTPHIASLAKEARLQMEIDATRNLINSLKMS